MKKQLSVLLMILIIALTFISCSSKEPAEYTVTFDINGGVAGEGFVESVTVTDGQTVAMTSPTMENYTFAGWFDGEELYTAETPITKNVALTAKWDFNNTYTLTFETNGMADVPASHPVIGELPAIPEAPKADGYVFAGWYFDAEYTTRYFFDYPLTEATTLYAKFYDTSLGEYIVISNVEQLMAIKDDTTAKYLLACDINCKGELLAPITEFTGEIEGNGYRIFNFDINADADNVAFICTNKGTVKNLTFEDFTFDVLMNGGGSKYYGVICGINEGTVENCHTVNAKMTVNYSTGGDTSINSFVGGLVGYNSGTVSKSTNDMTISASTYASGWHSIWDYNGHLASHIGGVVGYVETNGKVTNCSNRADVTVGSSTGSYGHNYVKVGGAIGLAKGYLSSISNTGNVTVKCPGSHYDRLYVGAGIGECYGGTVMNSYAKCEMTVDHVGTGSSENLVGGFAGYNSGKLYNCYSDVDIKSTTSAIFKSIGGLVGYNELLSGHESLINKCFALGSIELAHTPTNFGYFVGISTGTIKDPYYSSALTAEKVTVTTSEDGSSTETREPLTATNTVGTAKAENELLSLDLLENTLYFDREVWFLVEGKLPELR